MKKNKVFNFLLVGHSGSHNRGCEALVRSTVEILREQFPKCYITVASDYPEHDLPLLNIKRLDIIPGTSSSISFFDETKQIGRNNCKQVFLQKIKKVICQKGKSILPFGVVSMLRKRKLKNSPNRFQSVLHLKQAMLSADLVIAIGGDVFIDDYGPPIHRLETMEYAQFLGCKTVILGHSFWPFKLPWVEKRVKI